MLKKKIRSKIVFAAFGLLYLFYHLYTLSINPLPWFDETFYASVSQDYLSNRTLVPGVVKTVTESAECLIHGPVYYWLGAGSFSLFGFGIFQFRLVNFLFGMLLIIFCYLAFRTESKKGKVALLLLATMALDPFLNLTLHEGRMDLVAAAFTLAAIYLISRGHKENNLYFFLASGFLAVIALLTTPRIAVVLLAIVVVMFSYILQKGIGNAMFFFLVWALPFLILYPLWIVYAFESIDQLLAYYTEVQAGKHSANTGYIGGKLYIPKHQYLLIATAVVSIIYGAFKRGKVFFTPLINISITAIILFYILVRDLGPYSVLIIGFYYIIIFKAVDTSSTLNIKNPATYFTVILLFFNTTYFVVKGIQILSEQNTRSYRIADKFIKDNIPAGKKVIGDPMYYYSVTKAGSEYQYADLFSTHEVREKMLREDFDYDYIIVTDMFRSKRPHIIDLYFSNAKLEKVASLKIEAGKLSKLINTYGLVSNMEKDGYSANIYKRVRD